MTAKQITVIKNLLVSGSYAKAEYLLEKQLAVVPDDIDVKISSTSIFGGTSNKRCKSKRSIGFKRKSNCRSRRYIRKWSIR